MQTILSALMLTIANLVSLFDKTTDAVLKALYDELIDLNNTLKFVIEQSLKKGDNEERTKTKTAGIERMIQNIEAKISEHISGQLPNTLISILKANHEQYKNMLPTDSISLLVVLNPDGSVIVEKRKNKVISEGGAPRVSSGGKRIFNIDGAQFNNGNEAYKHLVSLFDGAEAFKQGTGISLRDGSTSFSAPAQIEAIANKGIFKGITITSAPVEPTAPTAPVVTTAPVAPTAPVATKESAPKK
jgi:hypothetical protein